MYTYEHLKNILEEKEQAQQNLENYTQEKTKNLLNELEKYKDDISEILKIVELTNENHIQHPCKNQETPKSIYCVYRNNEYWLCSRAFGYDCGDQPYGLLVNSKMELQCLIRKRVGVTTSVLEIELDTKSPFVLKDLEHFVSEFPNFKYKFCQQTDQIYKNVKEEVAKIKAMYEEPSQTQKQSQQSYPVFM